MNKIISIVLLLSALAARAQSVITTTDGSSQTNITFTNRTGEAVTNARVIRYTATMVYYALPDGGGGVKLADLPPALQKQFDYDPAKAAADLRAKEARESWASQQRYMALAASEIAASDKATRERVEKTKIAVMGRVIQKIDAGLLVDSGSEEAYNVLSWDLAGTPGANGICLLVGYDAAVDGEIIHTFAYPNGRYRYSAVSGAEKTVRRFNVNPATVQTIATPEELSLITNRSLGLK